MEEVLALILQLVLEVGLQFFGGLGLDFAVESRRSRGESQNPRGGGPGWLALFALFGGICGGISLIFAPHLILPNLPLRLANLVASPLIAGGLSYAVAAFIWAPRGQSPSRHFWRGFWFALAFGLIRFAYAHR